MALYGLIGKKLSHSFSKKYFSDKFEKDGLVNHRYELFELENITELKKVLAKDQLNGFNITIPYKQDILPFLHNTDESATKVGAVNVVKIRNGELTGYNSDYYGFKTSLEQWLPDSHKMSALVLGTGGASKAVIAALNSLKIDSLLVSRTQTKDIISYQQVTPDILDQYRLIINTTPLGMSPKIDDAPDIDYSCLTNDHYLYDLVYNPEVTRFLALGANQMSHTKNGLEMLHLQAEKSWEIWNTED